MLHFHVLIIQASRSRLDVLYKCEIAFLMLVFIGLSSAINFCKMDRIQIRDCLLLLVLVNVTRSQGFKYFTGWNSCQEMVVVFCNEYYLRATECYDWHIYAFHF